MTSVPVGFSWIDYLIFASMLLVSVIVGIYQSYFKPKQDVEDFLLGGRNMKVLPIAISLITSKVSAIMLIAIPTDVYRYGSDLFWMFLTVVSSLTINCIIFLPILFNLELTSMYEYLNLRFDKKTQIFASFLSNLSILLFNPLVMFLPALAFAQVSGISVGYVTPIVCMVCIFYTTVGGIKAVVWADVFQVISILIYCLTIFILGIISGGGFGRIYSDAYDGGRLSTDFTFDITSRQNFWVLLIGGFVHNIPLFGLHQDLVQKFLSLPKYSDVIKTSIIYCFGFNSLFFLNIFMGSIIYSRYKNCDPLINKELTAPDQIVPYYVMDIAGHIPGCPGIFITGLFSAALSTLSGHLSTAAATIYEDVLSEGILKNASERTINFSLKLIIVIVGFISTALVYVYEYMEGAFSIMIIIQGTINGPLLALFLMGMLMPKINTKGALSGCFVGLLFSSWISFSNYIYKSKGHIVYPTKPMSVEGCDVKMHAHANNATGEWQPFILYRISPWYYLIMCLAVSISIASIVSCFTVKDKIVTKDLVSPLVYFAVTETPEATEI
ncbi:hypothetical protein FQR65_LT12729 [Abscondita terminalis]|nr:hypothetical protein FQR65_LT12729 [Abscondita terminalis]